MTWTKQQYIDNWPGGPNPYSNSDEPCRNGQLVDDGAVLRAMAEHERLMAQCIGCEGDLDWEGHYRVTPKPGCPVHGDDSE